MKQTSASRDMVCLTRMPVGEVCEYTERAAGLALMITVFSINMFGDALRDLFEPRMRGGEGRFGLKRVKRKQGFVARLIFPF